jgi:hypothetical protein
MAQFPRTNGSAGGVMNVDVAEYENGSAKGVGVTVSSHGPKFTYIAVFFGANLTDAEFQAGGPVEAVHHVIQQRGIIATYEIAAVQDNTAPADVQRCSKYALYPTELDITTLQSDIRALGVVAGYDLTTAEVILSTFGA